MAGTKIDIGKLRMDLIPYEAEEALATVLTHGAEKYGDHNWRDGIQYHRIYGAMKRHLLAWQKGKKIDVDSNLPHLWLAFCELAFLVSYESMIALGKLPASLNDLPQYEKEFVCPEGWVIEQRNCCGWRINNSASTCNNFLWKDFTMHRSNTGWDCHKHGEAPGYWPTKEEAEAALTVYLEKENVKSKTS